MSCILENILSLNVPDQKSKSLLMFGEIFPLAEAYKLMSNPSTYLFLSILVLLIAVIILAVVFKIKLSLDNRLRGQLVEIESLKGELQNKLFWTQYNPHFIFNSLNSIQYLIMKGEKNEASEFLIKFSILLRRTLEDSDRRIISLNDEIEFLQIYLELESLRFDHNFDYSIQNTVKDSKDVFIAPFILQPIVENAVVHGLASKEGVRKLEIIFRSNSSHLVCEVNDTGIGRKASEIINKAYHINHKLLDKRTKGMELSKQRLMTFNNRVDEAAFKIIDLNDLNGTTGTSVVLTFSRN